MCYYCMYCLDTNPECPCQKEPDVFEIGDIVKHFYPHGLHSSQRVYDCAVLISVEPWILISLSTEMRWTKMHPCYLVKIGVATDDQLGICMRRFDS